MKTFNYSSKALKQLIIIALLFAGTGSFAQWTDVFAPATGSVNRVEFLNSTTGYYQDLFKMYKTTDGAVTWTEVDSNISGRYRTDMHFLNTMEGFVVSYEWTGSAYVGVFTKTTDGGANWSGPLILPTTEVYSAIHFTSSTVGYIAGNNGKMLKTINGGASWSNLTTGVTDDLRTIYFTSASTGYAAGYGRIIYTNNAGASWSSQLSNPIYDFRDIKFTSSTTGYAVGIGGIMKTTNAGAVWLQKSGVQLEAVSFPTVDTGYVVGPGKVYKTWDAGESWIAMTAFSGYFIRDVDFLDAQNGFACADYTGVHQTSVGAFACPAVSVPASAYACPAMNELLNSTPSAPNSYGYTWSPSTYLADPNLEDVTMNNPNPNDTIYYTVTLHDSVTGCPDTSATVMAYTATSAFTPTYPVPTNLLTLCYGDTIHVGAGADSYLWTSPGDTTEYYVFGPTSPTNLSCFVDACNSMSYFFFITLSTSCGPSSCSVFAGYDSIACYAPYNSQVMTAIPTPAGSNYTFSWSPAIGLSDPNVQNPYINNVYNQQYVVTMTDTVTGCVSTDTVLWSVNNAPDDSVNICSGSSAMLDFGPYGTSYNWQYYTPPGGSATPIGVTTQTLMVNSPGTYMGFANFPYCGALTTIFHVIDTCAATSCEVDAGPDTTICAVAMNSYQLQATPLSGSGSYTYSWSPSTGLSNPLIANPYVNDVHNQQYIVTMMDGSGCTSYDTVVVTIHNYVIDSVYMCGTSVGLSVGGSGGVFFSWGGPGIVSTDGAGNALVDTAGMYYCVASYAGGCAVTSTFTVIDSCISFGSVWPGDTDYNLVAENDDFLNIGLGYGTTGAARPSASIAWTAQPMTDWASDFSTGVNYKHADTNGDGLIDYLDAQAVFVNYSMTHPAFAPEEESRSVADLYLVANYDTVGLQDNVDFALMLGNTSLPIDSIYGIAYSINYETVLTYTQPVTTYSNSWFGNPATTTFSFEKPFHTSGYIDLAYSRKNQTNVGGSGQIGNCAIVTTDNLSGIDVLHVDIYDVKAVTSSGAVINLTVAGDSVVINENFTGINDIDLDQAIGVYPNPSNGMVNVFSTYKNIETITVYNTLGETLHVVSDPSMNSRMELSGLSNGMYIISVKTDKGSVNKRITISK